MQALDLHGIVLCAGLGTRLRPLTTVLPKPAVPVGPVPAALRNIEQLLDAGIPVVHCNTHYLAQELENELIAACRSRGISRDSLQFWNESELLETGGGISRIIHSLAQIDSTSMQRDALVVSGDIVADIPLKAMLEKWKQRKPLQTSLMVSLPLDKPRKDVTWVNLFASTVCGFGSDCDPTSAAARNWTARVFSNHQIISAEVLQRSQIDKRSSIDLFYRDALRRGEEIIHVPFQNQSHWFDIGTPEAYLHCIRMLNHQPDQIISLHDQQIFICQRKDRLLPAQRHRIDESTHDQSRLNLNHPEETRLGMSVHDYQKKKWRWLGRLHSQSHALLGGLSQLVAHFSSFLESTRSELPSSDLQFTSLPGSHLLSTRSHPDIHASAATLDDEVPFIHIPLTSASSPSRPMLSAPLLVPLTLVLPTEIRDSLQSESSDLFWILFTP